jgi:hypothetical protein
VSTGSELASGEVSSFLILWSNSRRSNDPSGSDNCAISCSTNVLWPTMKLSVRRGFVRIVMPHHRRSSVAIDPGIAFVRRRIGRFEEGRGGPQLTRRHGLIYRIRTLVPTSLLSKLGVFPPNTASKVVATMQVRTCNLLLSMLYGAADLLRTILFIIVPLRRLLRSPCAKPDSGRLPNSCGRRISFEEP